MKTLWTKLTNGCTNLITYVIAVLIIATAIFVPVTILAWCVQFWVLLF